MVNDLPDYTKLIAISVDLPENQQVIPRPKGGVQAVGDITTTASYQTVAEYAVTDDKQLQLTKIMISCDKDVQYKLVWDSTDMSIEVIVPSNTPFTDWFPWDYYLMMGDGIKKIKLQAKYPTDGEAGTCFGEIIGEEVTP